jgi:type III secretion protein U
LQVARLLEHLLWELLWVSLRCIGSAALVATLVQRLLIRSKFSFALVAPDLQRLQPFKGLVSLVKQCWLSIGLGAFQVLAFAVLVGIAGIQFWRGKTLDFALASAPSLWQSQALSALAMLFVLGAVEFWQRRRRHLKELSMTHDEMRREYRESEGEPLLKAERRALHEMMSRGELVARIRRAKVVVVERDG